MGTAEVNSLNLMEEERKEQEEGWGDTDRSGTSS